MNKKNTYTIISILITISLILSINSVFAEDQDDILIGAGVTTSVICENYGTYDGMITTSVLSDGTTIILEFDPALPNQDNCNISLSGSLSEGFQVRTLACDVTRDGQVLGGDMLSIKTYLDQETTQDNFWYDLNCDGNINDADQQEISPYTGSVSPAGSYKTENIVSIFSCMEHSDTEFCLDLTENNVEPRLPGITKIQVNLGNSIIPQLQISASSSTEESETFDLFITANDVAIENTEVTFNSETSYTNQEGKLSFTAPDVDENTVFTITANKDGYASTEKEITIEDIPAELPQLVINVGFSFTEGENFIVTILDEMGALVQDASVNFYGVTYITNSEGQVNIKAPSVSSDRNLYISTNKAGYNGATKTITILNDVVEIKQGQIGGTITEKDNYDSSIENVEVDIVPESGGNHYIFYTDEYGVYLSSRLPIGTYIVTASKSGFDSSTISNSVVNEGSVTVIDFELVEKIQDQGNIPADENELLFNYVISDEAKKGNAGAKISAESKEISLYSDEIELDLEESEINSITFTVSASDETTSKIIFIEAGSDTFSDLDELNNFVVTYDDDVIERKSLNYLINSDGSNSDPIWAVLSSIDDDGKTRYYFAVLIPHFSEHVISISSVSEIVEAVGGIYALAIYSIICLIGITAFTYPVFTGLVRRIFRVKKKKP